MAGSAGSCTRRGHGDALGIDTRQLRGVGPEHVGQHVREILQQMKAVRHLAGRGCPEARRFRIRLRAIPHDTSTPGWACSHCGHGRGFPVGEQGQGPPPFEVQQEGAIGMTLPQREIVHAEDLWGDHRGAGGAADHPQEGVPTDREAEVPAQPHPSRPTRGRGRWRGGVPPAARSAAPKAPQGRAVAR